MFKRSILVAVMVVLANTGNSFVWASELEVVEQDQKPVTTDQAVVVAIPQAPEIKDEAKTIVQLDNNKVIDLSQAEETDELPLPEGVTRGGVDEPTRYTLGPDDVIEIIVRRHPEFSERFVINAEGKIQYKFIGDIEIKGLTKTEVKDRVSEILSKFIITPDVDVSIVEYRSKVIYVIGEVGGPGKYYMKADQISVREAVVQAGLPQLTASMRRTELIRPDKTGKPKKKKIDLYALLYEGKLELDEWMYNGDVLVVPATVLAKVMRILNPITAPVSNADTLRRVGTGGF